MKVRTYNKFRGFVRDFLDNKIQFCIVRGNGGDGKTYTTQEMIEESGREHIFFSGHATPLSIYKRLMNNPRALVVFDDVDTLLKNKTITALLKQICEVKHKKDVRYSSTTHLLSEDEKEFVSMNKVMIICNDLSLFSKDLKALKTRAIIVEFLPHNSEIERIMREHIARGPEDIEIIDFLMKHVAPHQQLNFRMLTKAQQLTDANTSWKKYLSETFNIDSEALVVEEILESYARGEIDKREAQIEYMNATGKSRRSFYNAIDTTEQ